MSKLVLHLRTKYKSACFALFVLNDVMLVDGVVRDLPGVTM